MEHKKVAHRITRLSGAVQHGLAVGLTLMAILVADPALARRGNAELPPGMKPVPVERSAAHVAQAAAVRPQDTKATQRHGRHASKPHAGTSRSGAH